MLASLALLSIVRFTPDRFRFVLYGDCRSGNATHRKIVALTMKQHPAFVVQTGDLVDQGTHENEWKTYDEITGAMRKELPVYPAPGNHDFGGSGYSARLTAPIESGTKQYYSFTRGRWHFVSLAVDEHMPYGPSSEQYTWLVQDLKRAHDRKFDIAVFFHVPPYSISFHGSDLKVRAALCPLFAQFRVRLVMNGHDHIYYRTRREGITYIVSGGGGAQVYPALANNGEIKGDKWLAEYHIVVFDVDGDRMKAAMLKVDGSTFDSFEIDGAR